MKQKIFTLFLALAASVGTMFAWDYERVQIGDLYYNLDAVNETAEVTYEKRWDDTNYSGLTTANIPSSVDYESVTYSVTSIGDIAFLGCTRLTSVTIPNSVTEISNYAFRGCTGLTAVTIPNSVTSIGDYAFSGCTGLTSVTIPNSVTSIGNYAFERCSGLTSVTIPNSVTSIGDDAFRECIKLPVIDNIRYADTYLVEAVDKTLSTYTIKDGTKWIGTSAFNGCTGLTAVTIPNSVTSIGTSAFNGCSGLTAVTIGNSVTKIGYRAFYNCTGLTSVTIPNSVTSIGDRAFYNCSGLTSITIPNSVTSIGGSAFRGCSGLTSVALNSDAIVGKNYSSSSNIGSIFGTQVVEYIIGDDVTSIGEYAFWGCTGLTSVVIGNSVTSIGSLAFYNCTGLTSVALNSDAIVGKNYSSSSNIGSIFGTQVVEYIIGDDVTSIGERTFYGCYGLTSVTIPNSVTSIGDEAFLGCTGLTSIEIPNSVTSIGYNAFYNCSGLTSVTIPNSVTSIGNYAFEGCSGLTTPVYNAHVFAYMPTSYSGEYIIPEGIESIAGCAFYHCTGLTSVTIPNSVTSIGGSAFRGCSGLTSITIPNSVTSIGSFAFESCSGLTSITIGKDVPVADYWRICGTIDGKNVHNHPNLTQVEAPAWFFDVEENNWSYCPKYMTNIIVNAGTLTDNAFSVIKRNYKTLNALDIRNVENTALADEAFKDNYNLTELILPAGLTSVSYMAVAGCVSLKQIDIPASVEEIDNRAFEDCRSIETITFGGKQPSSKPGLRMEAAESKLRKIGNWAFYNAHQLQHLEIPEGVEEIGDGAFYGCTYLQDLILPKSIKAIGDNCFALCSHLERIDIEALTPPTIFARTFFDVSRQIPVYVPEDVVAEYLNDEYWKEMNIQGAPTAIEEVSGQQSEVRNQKIMRNGQLLILSNGGTYNAQGVRVE